MKLENKSNVEEKEINGYQVINDSSTNEVQSKENVCKIGLEEPFFKSRYVVVLLGFAADFFFYYHRITMTVSIVAMVNNTGFDQYKNEVDSDSCQDLVPNKSHVENSSAEYYVERDGEFLWTPKLQGYILGSSFLFFTITMPFSAKLAEIYGGKRVLFWSMFFSSVFTFVTPAAAKWSVYAVIVVQSLRGIAQSGILPTESVLVANWCPKSERGMSYTFICSGCSWGAVLGSYITGVLCESTLLGGWPSAFFVSGGTGFITSILILIFLYDNPSVHPKISLGELHYIVSNQEKVLTEKRPNTPWRCLLTSGPVYALAFAYFGQMWALSHFLSAHPTFLSTIMHYSVEEDGLFTALPFLLQFFTAQIGAVLSTLLNNRNYISVDKARKFWTLMSCFGYSVCVLIIYFAGCNRSITIAFSVLALASIGFGYAGCWIVSTDMSPTFAGSINAISCTMGCLAHFTLPVVVGYLTNHSQTMEQWHKIFFISIAIVMSSGIAFTIFGSAEIQTWNDVPEDVTEMKDQKIKQ